MENEIINLASSNGIGIAFSVTLVFYILRSQKKLNTIQEEREKKYQDIILELTDKLNKIEEVKRDITELNLQIQKVITK